jgi:hypothetical protein
MDQEPGVGPDFTFGKAKQSARSHSSLYVWVFEERVSQYEAFTAAQSIEA